MAEKSPPKDETTEPEVEATPAAEELAKDEGVDLTEVEGSGEEGRILKTDVEEAVQEQGYTVLFQNGADAPYAVVVGTYADKSEAGEKAKKAQAELATVPDAKAWIAGSRKEPKWAKPPTKAVSIQDGQQLQSVDHGY